MYFNPIQSGIKNISYINEAAHVISFKSVTNDARNEVHLGWNTLADTSELSYHKWHTGNLHCRNL